MSPIAPITEPEQFTDPFTKPKLKPDPYKVRIRARSQSTRRTQRLTRSRIITRRSSRTHIQIRMWKLSRTRIRIRIQRLIRIRSRIRSWRRTQRVGYNKIVLKLYATVTISTCSMSIIVYSPHPDRSYTELHGPTGGLKYITIPSPHLHHT